MACSIARVFKRVCLTQTQCSSSSYVHTSIAVVWLPLSHRLTTEDADPQWLSFSVKGRAFQLIKVELEDTGSGIVTGRFWHSWEDLSSSWKSSISIAFVFLKLTSLTVSCCFCKTKLYRTAMVWKIKVQSRCFQDYTLHSKVHSVTQFMRSCIPVVDAINSSRSRNFIIAFASSGTLLWMLQFPVIKRDLFDIIIVSRYSVTSHRKVGSITWLFWSVVVGRELRISILCCPICWQYTFQVQIRF